VAVLYKVGGLFSRFRINNSAKSRRSARFTFRHATTIGDNADKNAADPSRTADHLLSKIGLEFIEIASIKNGVEHGTHVVGSAVVFWENGVKLLAVGRWPLAVDHGNLWRLLNGKFRNEISNFFKTLLIVLCSIMGDARDGVMCHCSAECFVVD